MIAIGTNTCKKKRGPKHTAIQICWNCMEFDLQA